MQQGWLYNFMKAEYITKVLARENNFYFQNIFFIVFKKKPWSTLVLNLK